MHSKVSPPAQKFKSFSCSRCRVKEAATHGCPSEQRRCHLDPQVYAVHLTRRILVLGNTCLWSTETASHPLPSRRVRAWCVCATFNFSGLAICHGWFSWERRRYPGEEEVSQKPRALRVRVNCFLPGALGREPRSLSQRLQQYKQMPSTSSTQKRKMSCSASLNSPGGGGWEEEKQH